jgi:hypothetical protein
MSDLESKLKSNDTREKIQAAKKLGSMGDIAKSSAGALCLVVLDRSPQASQASLEALEKVRPDLYKPIVTLLNDKQESNKITAINELGILGVEARPAVPIIVHCLRKALAQGQASKTSTPVIKGLPPRTIIKRPTTIPGKMEEGNENVIGVTGIAAACLDAIEKIVPTDQEPIKVLVGLAGPSNRDEKVRLSTLRTLGRLGTTHKEHRSLIMPVVMDGLRSPSKNIKLASIHIAHDFGKDASASTAQLRKLKLADDERVRDKANAALDRIEQSMSSTEKE